MRELLNLTILLVFFSCALDTGTEENVAVVNAVDERDSFPGKYSVGSDEEYIDQIKALCLTTEEVPAEELLAQALGCLYAGELKKSYFLYKIQLPNVDKQAKKKSLVLNNMAVIQMNWGHRDLAESLFTESVDASRNILNTFNLLKLQVEDGTFSNESLIPFVENAGVSGPDLDLLRAKIAVVLRKNESAIQNFDSAVRSKGEILNYLYYLSNINSDLKFKEVANKYEAEIGDNQNFLKMNKEMGPQ